LHQRPHALLQEEGVALSACDQQVREGCQARVLPEERLQELVGTHRGQRIESHLRVVGLRTPLVLILRTIVDQKQQVSRGQALDQTVEEGLRLGINPVQVFADQQQWLPLTFAQQHALEGIERALAALRGVELQERALRRESVQKRQQRWERVLERLVQRQHLPGDLGPYRAYIVIILHVAVSLE